MSETIVMLHGFGGTHRAWDGVVAALDPERYLPMALDLPGHGVEADAERPITFDGCVAHVLAAAPERFALCGYSMGGRIALHVALAAPERVSRLILVSCSAGIENPHERSQRRAADESLALELKKGKIEAFIQHWGAQPIFAGDPPEVGRLAREDQRRNRPEALATVMRGIGTGKMEPLWDRLGELEMPTTVIAGNRDGKFVQYGRRMAALLPRPGIEILPGGHRLLLEHPVAVASALEAILDR